LINYNSLTLRVLRVCLISAGIPPERGRIAVFVARPFSINHPWGVVQVSLVYTTETGVANGGCLGCSRDSNYMNYPEMSSAFPRLTEKQVRGSSLPNLSVAQKQRDIFTVIHRLLFPMPLLTIPVRVCCEQLFFALESWGAFLVR
jgi:hypothetical protein